jgi:hypothetical protein
MTTRRTTKLNHIAPTHPGIDLLELINDHGITQYRAARELECAELEKGDEIAARVRPLQTA